MGKDPHDANLGRSSVANSFRFLTKCLWRFLKSPQTLRLLMGWLRLFNTIMRLFD